MFRLWVESVLDEGRFDIDFIAYSLQVFEVVHIGDSETSDAFWYVSFEELVCSYCFLRSFIRRMNDEGVDIGVRD